jgi:hypothetical protein
MSPVSSMFHTVTRAGCAAIAAGSVSLAAACAESPEPTPCTSDGVVFTFDAPVVREDGSSDEILLFLVCDEDDTVTIIDAQGNTYKSLEEFQADNELLTEEDRLFLPDDFPAVEQAEDVKLMEVAGRTEKTPPWLIIGGIAAALFVAAVVVRWLFRPWRSRRDPDSDQ